MVDVRARGVTPGEGLSIDVSPPGLEVTPVAFEGIEVTPNRGGDFTMTVTSTQNKLPDSPGFEPDDGAEALGRVRLEHSISNANVTDVGFTFSVSKVRLEATDTDPEEVALYRYDNGSWSRLPTDVVGETPTRYELHADSPGMSEFAIGAMQPEFDTFWADLRTTETRADEPVRVSGRVSNVGGADGVYDATLTADGEVVAQRQITVASQGTRQVNFQATFDDPGTYEVAIDGTPAGTVEVEEPTADPTPTPAEPTEPGDPLAAFVDRLLGAGVGPSVPSAPTVPVSTGG